MKFPQKVAFMANFHQKMPVWQISTKKVAFIENFHQTLLGWKISTTMGFVGKFPQKSCFVRTFSQNKV